MGKLVTFRMKLGNWISGGRWSRWNEQLIREVDHHQKNYILMGNKAVNLERSLNEQSNLNDRKARENRALRYALIWIDSIETPKAAHGVRKAAKIAREALGYDEDQ